MSEQTSEPAYGPDDARRDLAALAGARREAETQLASERLAAYLGHLEALKTAADEMVYQSLHPKRKGKELLNAVVAYRRLSEGYGE